MRIDGGVRPNYVLDQTIERDEDEEESDLDKDGDKRMIDLDELSMASIAVSHQS